MEDPPSFVLWIPALEPRRMEHCVTFADVAATVQARDGIYTSICDVRFAPAAPMTTPPWPHCPHCAQLHQQWVISWHRAHPTPRPPSMIRGLLRRLTQRPTR
jgi:hypothetical protein